MLDYTAPSTVEEAVRILVAAPGTAKVLSGGTDLLVQLRSGRAKPGLIVINTARGAIIDLDALEAAMRAGLIAGAGIDVLSNEPSDMDHPLFAAWRKGEDWIKGGFAGAKCN